LDFISGGPLLSVEGRLGIYAEGYFSRLVESLEADFAATKRALGESAFLKLCADFLKAHPSRCFNIGEVGERLPEFLESYALLAELRWVPELARLEWCVIESFHADDRPRLDPGALRALPPEAWPQAGFALGSSVRLLASRFEVERLWRERLSVCGEAGEGPQLDEPGPAPGGLVVFRGADGFVEVSRLEPAAFEALSELGRGATLGELCEKLGAAEGDELPPLMDWFSGWIASGVIGSIRLASEKRDA
jgi:hypothetical protein